MKNYACPKCGSVDVFIQDKGSQKGLYCSDCTSWIKWIPKKELVFVEKYIEDQSKDVYKLKCDKETLEVLSEDCHYTKGRSKLTNTEVYKTLGKREMLWSIQKQIVALNKDDISSYEQKYYELVNSIKSIGIHLEFQENLNNVEDIIDSEIDNDMIKDSKYMLGIM